MARHRECTVKINTNLSIPVQQPAVSRILRATICPQILKTVNISRKVVFWGDMRLDIEYTAKGFMQTEPIFLFSTELPFTHFIKCSQAKPDTDAKLSASIEFQQLELLSPRIVSVYILANIRAVNIQYKPYIAKAIQCEFTSRPASQKGPEMMSSGSDAVPMIRRQLRSGAWNRRI